MTRTIGAGLFLAVSATAPVAFAQDAESEPAQPCDVEYIIQGGDSLARIAERAYGDQNDWTRLFYANQRRLGDDPAVVFPGQSIYVPCAGVASEAPAPPPAAADETQAGATQAGEAVAAEPAPSAPAPRAPVAAAPTAPAGAEPEAAPAPETETETALPPRAAEMVRILTAGDYAPFTDRALPRGGMLTNLVERALERAEIPHSVTWINDWAAHLDPLLLEHAYDIGFPWFQPPCDQLSDNFRCQNFLFSDPLFEMLITLFVGADSTLAFDSDEDLVGATLCRPSGYFTFDLDANGRNWLKDDKIVLMQPQQVSQCFDLLLEGAVDAVAINEFTGRQTIAQMRLQDQVRWLPRPLAVQPLHMLTAKTHPRATVMLYRFNQALRDLQNSGEYDEIVSEHLELFWRDNG